MPAYRLAACIPRCYSQVCLLHRHTAPPGQEVDETPKPLTARASHAAVALDQRLMLLGGESKGALVGELCIGETLNVQVCSTQSDGQACVHVLQHPCVLLQC